VGEGKRKKIGPFPGVDKADGSDDLKEKGERSWCSTIAFCTNGLRGERGCEYKSNEKKGMTALRQPGKRRSVVLI